MHVRMREIQTAENAQTDGVKMKFCEMNWGLIC